MWSTREEVPAALLEKERDIARSQVVGKPANVIEKIVEGKIDKFFSTICLLDQVFIKSTDNQLVSDSREIEDRGTGREHRDPPLHPLHGG